MSMPCWHSQLISWFLLQTFSWYLSKNPFSQLKALQWWLTRHKPGIYGALVLLLYARCHWCPSSELAKSLQDSLTSLDDFNNLSVKILLAFSWQTQIKEACNSTVHIRSTMGHDALCQGFRQGKHFTFNDGHFQEKFSKFNWFLCSNKSNPLSCKR